MYLDRFQNLRSLVRTRVSENRSDRLRMHRNEKINNWPKELRKDILGTLPDSFLQRYPNHGPFYNKLSEFLGLPENRFVVTSGIDEAAKSLLFLCCAPGDNYVAVWPGYAMYGVYGQMVGANMTSITYDPHNYMNPSELLKLFPEDCKLAFIPNPSQPVENYFPLKDMRYIAKECAERNILLAIDEAYHFFGSDTAVPLTDEFDNVVVLRTFSKAFGAAGLRLGYVIGSELSLAPLAAFRIAHEANGFGYHVGEKLLAHFEDHVSHSIADVCEGRDFFREQCLNNKLKAWGSFGNFVLVEFDSKNQADVIVQGLEECDIVVRGNLPGKLEKSIMITCGPIATMRQIFDLVRDFIGKG